MKITVDEPIKWISVFMFEFICFIKPMNDLAHRLNTPVNTFESCICKG